MRGGGKPSCINIFSPIGSELSRVKSEQTTVHSLAFTLAETLITIGMIGIIATLTLPTLMSGTNDKEIVAKVKKTYANLNEALGHPIVYIYIEFEKITAYLSILQFL